MLLAFGYAPVTANVSNTIGLVPGSVSGALGYRRELCGQRGGRCGCGTARCSAACTGAVLLLVLPASAFKAIVPVFIAVALVLSSSSRGSTAGSPARPRVGRTSTGPDAARGLRHRRLRRLLRRRPGILLLGILGVALPQSLQRTNALKNVLAGSPTASPASSSCSPRTSPGRRRR